MSFLQPWAAWFLAGVPLIVLLYMIRLKRRSLTVSTHLFWERVLQQSSRRAFFHRLRHIWSLLLHLLIYFLIVAALARPGWWGSERSAHSTVILVDLRARMKAIEADGSSRLEKARQFARDAIRRVGGNSSAAIVTYSGEPEVLQAFTSDPQVLTQAVEKLRASDASGDLSPAISLSRELLAGRPGNRELMILTDQALELPATPREQVTRVHALGSSRDNLAITRFSTRANPASPETVEILLELQNFSRAAAKAEVEFALDGRVFDLKAYPLEPGQSRLETLTSVPRVLRGGRGWLTAKLIAPDSLASDNTAYAALPARTIRRVLLVSPGNSFLERLLAVDPGTRYQLIAPEGWQPSLAEKFEIVVFDRSLPADLRWESASGRFLFIGQTPFNTGTPSLDRPLFTTIDGTHPLLRNVNLQNVELAKAQALQIPAAAEEWRVEAPLASLDQPMLIAASSPRARIVAVGFDFLQSDLPLRVAFPLLISNALTWLDQGTETLTSAVTAGSNFTVPPDHRIATTPATAAKDEPAPSFTQVSLRPTENGFYLVEAPGSSRWLAVNTFSGAESDLRRPGGSSPDPPLASAISLDANFPIWTWLTFAALALFTGEWWLFHRRKTE